MHDESQPPIVSPDGRFEIIYEIKQEFDRGTFNDITILVERATDKRLITWEGWYRAEFAEDGMLTIHLPGFTSHGVQIDPAKLAFRTHISDLWLPIAMWGTVEYAYQIGYSDGARVRRPTPFPLVGFIGMLISVAALAVLSSPTTKSSAMNSVYMVIASIGVVICGWLAAQDIRAWMQERRKE
jgi:hypothetical protein